MEWALELEGTDGRERVTRFERAKQVERANLREGAMVLKRVLESERTIVVERS